MAIFSLSKTVRSTTPSIPFSDIASVILPSEYELSLVLIGDTLGHRLNKEHKGRDYPTNILSFPLSQNEGEIFINVRRAERDASKYHAPHTLRSRTSQCAVETHIMYLFIHGCLHLAGYPHGSTMDTLEKKYLNIFSKK